VVLMRTRLCKVCGGWHDLDQEWPHNCREWVPQMQFLAAPRVVSDTLPPLQSQVTGAIHDSKSNLRREYRRHGMEEVGNDPAQFRPKPKPKVDRQGIRAAIERANSRVNLTS